jgi:N-methylhydantoinase B
MTNTRNAPVEIMEQTHPLTVTEYALVPNSEGAGKYRGGFGMTRAVQTHVDAMFTMGSDRYKNKPWGVFGGKHAAGAKMYITREGEERKELPIKCTIPVIKEDLLKTVTPGGGGWGNPFEREAEKVLWDVKEGLVSVERAESVYGVAINTEKMEIDKIKTEKLRR